MTYTHTYVTLDVSHDAYTEIKQKLEAAGYQHAFHDDGDSDGVVIDMHGLALVDSGEDSHCRELEKAAIAMCRKLTAIERNEDFQTVFGTAFLHGVKYGGPNYTEDLNRLMSLIPVEIAKEIREKPESEWTK